MVDVGVVLSCVACLVSGCPTIGLSPATSVSGVRARVLRPVKDDERLAKVPHLETLPDALFLDLHESGIDRFLSPLRSAAVVLPYIGRCPLHSPRFSS